MGEASMQGNTWLGTWFLGTWVVLLSLTHAVQATTLTKLRVVESSASSQVILSATDRPSYRVIPLLEHNRLVIHLSDTTASLTAPLPPLTGSLIQAIQVIEDAPEASLPPGTAEVEGGVRVEVLLKTSEVTFTHETLDKPPGMLLIIRTGKATSKAGGTPDTPPPLPSKLVAGPTATVLPHEHVRIPTGEPSPAEERPSRPPPGDASAPPPPSALTAEDVKGLMEDGTAGESLTLLELYLNHRTVFLTNPSLLWQVAATYADLALYDEAVALYSRILEWTRNPLVQAAARVKRGKLALLQGEWGTAETLLQQFVKAQRHGPFLGEAYEALGDVLAAQGKFGGAVEAYTAMLVRTPAAQQTPQIFYKLGRAQKRVGNWLKAAEAFQSSIDRLPLQASPPNSVEFRVATVESPTRADPQPSALEVAALQELGESLYTTQQFQAAAAAYRRVLERAHEDWQTAWARYGLGRSYEKLGRHDEALQAYRDLAGQGDPLWAEMGNQALADMQWRGRYRPD